MRTIALINQKGGCGKTTGSINLAACLAHLGQRTLLVDMDPQGHCAVGLAVPDQQIEKSVYDILRAPAGTATLKDITWQIASNFDLAPAAITLAALETELHGVPGRQDRLADALDRVAHDYDYCVIDCPPNVGLLTFNAMRAASDVVIPVETGYFSLHGLTKQLELLEQLRKQCRQEIKIRILATLYDIRTKLAREVLAELREQFGELLMESSINFNTKLKEAASFGQPITEYDPASKGFRDFQKLARELMGPAPRLSLDLARPAQPVVAAEQPVELAIHQARDTIDETLQAIETAVDFKQPISLSPDLPTPGMRIRNTAENKAGDAIAGPKNKAGDGIAGSHRPAEFQNQSDSLNRRAAQVKSAARKSMGVSSQARAATTAQKLEEFYGVRQVPEGLLFIAHFPNAQAVDIAGDFNGWKPQRMVSAASADGNGAPASPDTFRTLVALKPGRYRYRLIVDGRWQPDPHNVHAQANPYGEMDSVVEVS